jgi:transcription antitermination factor NusG
MTTLPWYAVHTRAKHEKAVAAQLAFKGYEVFMPTRRVRKRWSDRMQEIEAPLFEGYTFCRLDLSLAGRIVTTPGVIRILGIGNKPLAIDDAEIAAIQRVAASGCEVAPVPYLEVGQRVRIEAGSLAGVEGILQSVRGANRLVVSVSLLQRSVAVEIDAEMVAAA